MDLIGEKQYRGYSWLTWSDDGYNHKVLLFRQLSQSMWKPVKTIITADEPSEEWVKGKIDEEIYEDT